MPAHFLKITNLYSKAATLFLLVFAGLMFAAPAEAQVPFDSVEGWAWSDTIGWISMNCTTGGPTASNPSTDICSDVSYGVTVDSITGNLSGYAWSDSIGWIKFDGLSSFPTAPGTVAASARAVNNGAGGYRLEGWARACAGTQFGNCSTMTNAPGGWDGWIALSGASHNITFSSAGSVSSASTAHWAWGSTVVGWVDFTDTYMTIASVILDFTATPPQVSIGSNTTLQWELQGTFASCTASNNRGQTDWSGSVAFVAGVNSVVVTPPLGATTYTLTCVDTDGVTHTDSVSVDARSNIAVDTLDVDRGSATFDTSTNQYDGVILRGRVLQVPNGQTVNYTFTLYGVTRTGSLTGNASGINNITATYDNVPFGIAPASLQVDLPAPGSVPEDIASTVVNEDIQGNSLSINATIPPAAPSVMSLTFEDDLVKQGTTTDITYVVTSSYQATCQVVGLGDSGPSFAPFGVSAGATVTGTITSAVLTSTTQYALRCRDTTTNTPFVETNTVEVTPLVEEI